MVSNEFEQKVYLNYVSKPRVMNTPEEQKREFRTNNGKIVTKPIWKDDFRGKRKSGWEYRTVGNLNWLLRTIDVSYETFQIPKHSGGLRTITTPNNELKALQRRFLKIVHDKNEMNWKESNNSHGFTKHKNIKTANEVHLKHKSRWFLKVDIHDFFGSTTEEMVRKALKENVPFCFLDSNIIDGIVKLVTYHGIVPQGAPTSPWVCNLVMNSYDYKIQKYCKENGIIYTRYADDMLFSSEIKWDYTKTLAKVKKILDPYTISEHKTRFGSFNGRNWNLGIMYTHDNNGNMILSIGHEKKHYLKIAVHNYVTKEDSRSDAVYYKIMGQLAFGRFIEPNNETLKRLEEQMKPLRPATHNVSTPIEDINALDICPSEDEDLLPWA